MENTPRFKENAVFLFSKEDQFRPEVVRFHNTVRKFKTRKNTLVIVPDRSLRPFYLSEEYNKLKRKFAADINDIQFCQYNPLLGIIPLELSDMYPAAHYVMADLTCHRDEFPQFLKTWIAFLKQNKFRKIYTTGDDFLTHFAKVTKTKIKFFGLKNNKK